MLEKLLSSFPPIIKEDKSIVNRILAFLKFDLLLFFAYGLLLFCLKMLIKDINFGPLNNLEEKSLSILRIIKLVFLIPVIEELAFRLGLKPTRINLAVTFGLQMMFLSTFLGVEHLNIRNKILLAVVTSGIFYFFISKRLVLYIKQNLQYFIFTCTLLFSLIHLPNYNLSSWEYLYLGPFLVLFHFFFGLYLSTTRIRYSFLEACFFHILHNSIIISVGLLV